MKHHHIFVAIVLLLFVGLGCNLPAKLLEIPSITPTVPPTAEEELIPSTKTATPTPPPTEPVVEGSEQIGDSPPNFPIGFFTAAGDRSTLSFYGLEGSPLGAVQIPEIFSNFIHVAGNFNGNIRDIPIVFHTTENNGDVKQILDGEVTTLFPGPDVVNLLGAPGQNAFMYTTVTWDGNALVTSFFVRSQYGGGATPIYTQADPNSWAMFPLAVIAENAEVQTIWYCWTPWGIGGDIVFPPRKGLWTFDLESADFNEILFESDNVIGMSPNNALVAYTEQNNVVHNIDTHVILYNLTTTESIQIPILPTSDRGSGFAVFSPDNQYLGWMEASGSLMGETPNFNTRVRIANRVGTIIADIPNSTFADISADPTARWAVPVGWLDGEYLLVEVRGDEWENPTLVKMRFDGTEMAYLATGKFIGFLYP